MTYTNNSQLEDKMNAQKHSQGNKKDKILGSNFIRNAQILYKENYKTL